MTHVQLRRRGRNAYLAKDVDLLLGMLKLELAQAHQQSYEARRELQQRVSAPPPELPPDVALALLESEKGRLTNDVTMLEQIRTSLIVEIAERRIELADLDEALRQRREHVAALARELLIAVDRTRGSAVGQPPPIDLTAPTVLGTASLGDRDLDPVLLPVTGRDQRRF